MARLQNQEETRHNPKNPIQRNNQIRKTKDSNKSSRHLRQRHYEGYRGECMNLKNFLINASKIVGTLEKYDNSVNYQNLISHLTTGRTSPTPELEKSIRDTRVLISKVNRQQQASLDAVPHSEYVIEKLGITGDLGDAATKRITKIIEEEVFNAPSSIEVFVQEINTSLSQLKTILAEMHKFGLEYESPDTAMMSIEYLGDYVVDDTEALKARLSDIEDILRAYARLSNQPEAFKKPYIVNISKSSPLIIDVGSSLAIYPTLILVAKGITWAMARVEQAIKIRIEYEELKQKKITSSTMKREFKTLETAETSEKNIKNFVNQLYKEHNPKNANSVENEAKKDLLEATKLMVKMIEGGVLIKVYPPENRGEKDTPDVSQLCELNLSMSATYKKIGKQQGQLKLLESESKKTETKPSGKKKNNGA